MALKDQINQDALAAEWGVALEGEQQAAQSAPVADQKALASFCHALVNSAAFLYID